MSENRRASGAALQPELEAALFFLAADDIRRLDPFGEGKVNDTYLVTLASGEQRVLQRVNPAVFPDPMLVVANMRLVTDHLLRSLSGRERREQTFRPLTLYEGRSGYAFQGREGSAWRMTGLIQGGRICRRISSAGQARELGRALGLFHSLVRTLDPATLADTLPGFHWTPGYLARYDLVRAEARKAAAHHPFCRQSIENWRHKVHLLEDHGATLFHSVIHGDPKTDNFLFDESGRRVISLIDLDTVRTGFLLHDLGDALRSCCNRAGESPAEPGEAQFDPDLYTAWLQGYFSTAGDLLSGEDHKWLVDAVQLITFELGLRFYTDYLEGNRYFKITRPGDNLRRALSQFCLAKSIERQRGPLTRVVTDLTAAGKRKRLP